MPKSSATTRRFIVSGRVQGVAFRAWTREQAESLGLAGWARNLSDGRVEVVASGDETEVARLEALLHRGPPAARVTKVDELSAEPVAARGFTIG